MKKLFVLAAIALLGAIFAEARASRNLLKARFFIDYAPEKADTPLQKAGTWAHRLYVEHLLTHRRLRAPIQAKRLLTPNEFNENAEAEKKRINAEASASFQAMQREWLNQEISR